MKLTVKAVDGEWEMGEDLVLEIEDFTTVYEIKEMIKAERGCPISRQRIDVEPKEAHHGTIDSCPFEKLGLDMNGEAIITVAPTRHNAFLWHPLQYYEDKLAAETQAYLEARGGGPVDLAKLGREVRPPPPLRYKLKVYLRKYPETFHLEYDTQARIENVSLNVKFKPPIIF
mmetsp:Transcript_8074/g.13557  ORF Transcript_8074/g.13557 Transcript_8074/m.13557 type:complete len:172 (+) Transcript_8074:513-1028(+)